MEADMITTTLTAIRAHSPCESGWKKLLAHLGKTKADNEPLSLAVILKSNGFDNAIWCLRAVEGHDREMRLYAVWCARQVQHLMREERSIAAIDVAERFANGEATLDELRVAARAAADAAVDAADAAYYAADAAYAYYTADAAYAYYTADAAYAAYAAYAYYAADAARAAADAAYAAYAAYAREAQEAQEARFREVFCAQEVTA
jgi:hypothetical protein